MKRSKFSEEHVAYALRQEEAGTAVDDLCRQVGISKATFYAWKKKYAHLGVSELRRLRQPSRMTARSTGRPKSICCRSTIGSATSNCSTRS